MRMSAWADAERHLLGWGAPVISEAEKLEGLLSAIRFAQR